MGPSYWLPGQPLGTRHALSSPTNLRTGVRFDAPASQFDLHLILHRMVKFMRHYDAGASEIIVKFTEVEVE